MRDGGEVLLLSGKKEKGAASGKHGSEGGCAISNTVPNDRPHRLL